MVLKARKTQPRSSHVKGRGSWKAPKGWKATRKRVLERDGYRCKVCDAKVGKGGRRAHIHHLLGRGSGNEKDYDLVTLCASCHELLSILTRNAKALVRDQGRITILLAYAKAYILFNFPGYLR